MGSSFGGAASLLYWAREGEAAAAVVWSTPGDFAALAQKWEEAGERDMDPVFFDDLSRVDLAATVAGLAPVLLVHGEEDEVVPVAQAHLLLSRLGPLSRLVVIHGADHRLSVPGALETALQETLAWLRVSGLLPAQRILPAA